MPETSEPRDRKTRLRRLAEVPRFSIESAHVHPERLVIERAGSEFKLDLRQMELLVALASHPGQDWSKDELMEAAWRSIEFSDSMLHKNMSILRDALGDDPKSPICIQSLPKKGYRLIGQVRGIDNRLINPLEAPNWAGLNPYVGLAAFDSQHEDVFFGRDDLIQRVHAAIRSQHRNGQGFVLIVGSSGCGKTSLLQAGVLPPMRRDGGVDGLQALALARCDFGAAQPGELLHHLAAALCTWQLHGRSVFHEPSATTLAETLTTRPDSLVAAIDDAWLKWPAALRDKATEDAHLLLVIDHAEALVGKQKDEAVDTQGNADLARERAEVETVVNALCSHPRVLVIAVVRGDYYAQLADALPVLMARKGGEGHVDVPLPQPAEITQMIRGPAAIARLTFDQRPSDGARLDDVLRDATIGQPDALPLLQHTLAALCEARDEQDTLTFAAYEVLGGLEGALERRAKEVFESLPDHVQLQLDTVLSLLIRLDGDTDRVRGRSALWTMLPDDPARALVNAFINARLFVSGGTQSRPDFRVAHEALLRQWPQAREWIENNRRLLLAHARLERAAARWSELGNRDDLLLNPGQPLGEALEVAQRLPERMESPAREFLTASSRAQRNKRRWRRGAIAALMLSTVVSAGMAYSAWRAGEEAEARGRETQRLAEFMLVDLGDPLQERGELKLLRDIADEALDYLQQRPVEALNGQELINLSKAFRTTGIVLSLSGKSESALTALASAEDASREAIRMASGAPDVLYAANLEAGQVSFYLGYEHYRLRDFDLAEAKLNDYLRFAQAMTALREYDAAGFVEASFALNSLGTLALDRGKTDEAATYFARSMALKQLGAPADSGNLGWRFEVNDTDSWINRTKEAGGLLQAAAFGYDRNIHELQELILRRPDALTWQYRLAEYRQLRSLLALSMGQTAFAAVENDKALASLTTLTDAHKENMEWKGSLAYSRMIDGEIADSRGDHAAARKAFALARKDFAQQLRKEEADKPKWRRLLSRTRWLAGRTTMDTKSIDVAVAELEALLGEHPDDRYILAELAQALVARAELRQWQRDPKGATADALRVDALLVDRAESKIPQLVALWVDAHRIDGIAQFAHKHDHRKAEAWLRDIGYEKTILRQ